METPEVTAKLPGVTIPVPPEKTGVNTVTVPSVIKASLAVIEFATGGGTTVIVATVPATAPTLLVTVNV